MVTAPALLHEIRTAVAAVPDPEIPVLTIEDLGVLRDVTVEGDTVVVTITPTYTGCPAMGQIADDIRNVAGRFGRVEIVTVYNPPWSTDWITEGGRAALRGFGIAPPAPLDTARVVLCPRCASEETRTISEFGSTACKALMVCARCREPFDLFKTL